MASTAFTKTVSRSLRLDQFNLGRSMVKTGELGIRASQGELDLVALQEPYVPRGEMWDFGLGVEIVTNGSAVDPPRAGIVVFRPGLSTINLRHLGDSHTVEIEVTLPGGPLYIVSMYCRFLSDLRPYLDRVKKILSALQGRRIIHCLDSNAMSPAWNSPITDDRGRALEDLLVEVDLHVVNQPGSPATFVSYSGESHIDVTLATHPGEIWDWVVNVSEDDDDHRLITFTCGQSGRREAVRDAVDR